jgi:hypothetical protein
MDLTSYAGIGGYKRLRNISNLILPDDDEIIFDEIDKNNIELNNTLENEIYIDVDSNDTFTFDNIFSDGVELFNDQISEINSNSSSDEIFVKIRIEIISSDIF